MRKFLFEIGQKKSREDKLWNEFKKIAKIKGFKNLHLALWSIIKEFLKKENPSFIKKIFKKKGEEQ